MDNPLISPGKADPLGVHNHPAAPFRFLDHEPGNTCLLLPACPLLAHLHQCPHPALVPGTTGLDPLPDPGLLHGQFLIKIMPLLLLPIQNGLPAFEVTLVITGKGKQTTPVYLHDPCGQTLEKGPVMGHKHECLFMLEQEILKP